MRIFGKLVNTIQLARRLSYICHSHRHSSAALAEHPVHGNRLISLRLVRSYASSSGFDSKSGEEDSLRKTLATLSIIREHARQIEAYTENLSSQSLLNTRKTAAEQENTILTEYTEDGIPHNDIILWKNKQASSDSKSGDNSLKRLTTEGEITHVKPPPGYDVVQWNNSKGYFMAHLPQTLEDHLRDMAVSSMNVSFEMDMTNIKDALKLDDNTKRINLFRPTTPKSLKDPSLSMTSCLNAATLQSTNKTTPLVFQALIQGTVEIDPAKFALENSSGVRVPEFNDYVTTIATNICTTALQKGFPMNASRLSYSTKANDKARPRNPHIVCVREGDKGCVSPGNSDYQQFVPQGQKAASPSMSNTTRKASSAPAVAAPSAAPAAKCIPKCIRSTSNLLSCDTYARAIKEASKRRAAVCEEKKNPCKKQEPKKKPDPCKKDPCDFPDPCKKQDPCEKQKPKKKCEGAAPIEAKKGKSDPCAGVKSDPCKVDKSKPCQQDPCKSKKSTPCKKDDGCSNAKKSPCKTASKQDSGKKASDSKESCKSEKKSSCGGSKKEKEKCNPPEKKTNAKSECNTEDPCKKVLSEKEKCGGKKSEKKEIKKKDGPKCGSVGKPEKPACGASKPPVVSKCAAKKSDSKCGAKKPESKCGAKKPESKCGAKKPEAPKCGAKKPESKCGAQKKPEPKCGAKKPESKCAPKKSESKCGAKKPESKCGAQKKPESKCGAKKPESKCAPKKSESKCAAKKKPESKCGAQKKPESKCAPKKSESKCGAQKKPESKCAPKKSESKCAPKKSESKCGAKKDKKGGCPNSSTWERSTKPNCEKKGSGPCKKSYSTHSVPSLYNVFTSKRQYTTMSAAILRGNMRNSFFGRRSTSDDAAKSRCQKITQKFPKNRKPPKKPQPKNCFPREECPRINCKPASKTDCKSKVNNKKGGENKQPSRQKFSTFTTPYHPTISYDRPRREFSTCETSHKNKNTKADDDDDDDSEDDDDNDCYESNNEFNNEVIRIMEECTIERVCERMPPHSGYDVLVRTDAVALSGSDVHVYETGGELCRGISLGHDATGVVEKVGKWIYCLKPGDRVALESGISCGICDFCKQGTYNMCAHLMYNGFLRKFQVHPADLCHKLPDTICTEEGALVQTMALGCQACSKANISPLSKVLIIGSCPTSISAALCARSLGAKQVCIVSTMPNALELIRKHFNFEYALYDNYMSLCEIQEQVYAAMCDWPNVIINCAISEVTMNLAVMALQPCGVCVLAECETECAAFNVMDVLMKNIKMISSYRSSNMFPTAIQLMESGQAPIGKLICKVYSWQQMDMAFRSAQHESNIGNRKVIVRCIEDDDSIT